MQHERSSQARSHNLLQSIVTVALAGSTIFGASACARPTNLDLALSRATEKKAVNVQIRAGIAPIPISKMHQWSLHVTGLDGVPVSGASIKVDGGMPQHHHGLPTAPRVEQTAVPGDYVIKGMKFSMTGWWVLNVAVSTPDGRTDKATFNIVL